MQTRATRRRFLLCAPVGLILGDGQANADQSTGSLIELTATEAVPLLRSGELSAERYAQALLDQCRKQRALNAFIWQDETQVLEAARTADKKRGAAQRLGPLHGLPILVKDNIDTANAPTTAGTPALRDHHPVYDAPVVASLFSAGPSCSAKQTCTSLRMASLAIMQRLARFTILIIPR